MKGRSADSEAGQALRRLRTIFDPRYGRVRRPSMAPFDKLLDRVGLAFYDYFHAAIGEVARPAGDAKRPGLVCAATAEPDALDPPAYPEVSAHHGAKLAPAGLPAHRPTGPPARLSTGPTCPPAACPPAACPPARLSTGPAR